MRDRSTDACAASLTFPRSPVRSAPANLSAYKLGDIIRTRPVALDNFGPDADRAFQILYRTNGQDGNKTVPDATVTTLISPKKPAPGPPRIVTIATPENSAALDCAPSYTYITGTKSNNTLEVTLLLTPLAALHQGWWANAPDFEGSKAAWLVGRIEGPAMLDAMRVAMRHNESIPSTIANQSIHGINGYSGGSHAVMWAAQLASTYAPELKIAGVVAGGLPANVEQSVKYIDGTGPATLEYMGASGLGNGYPELNKLLFDRVKDGFPRDLLETVHTGVSCAQDAYLNGPLVLADGFTKVNGKNISESPILNYVFDRENLGADQPPLKNFPTYLVHSRGDEIVPYNQSRAYAESQCSKGATIEYESLASGIHVLVGVQAQPVFIKRLRQYFSDYMAGKKPSGTCTFPETLWYPNPLDVAEEYLGPMGTDAAQQSQQSIQNSDAEAKAKATKAQQADQGKKHPGPPTKPQTANPLETSPPSYNKLRATKERLFPQFW